MRDSISTAAGSPFTDSQRRTLTYDKTTQSRLLTATNPENGTVSYTYNYDGTLQSKTDAKNIKAEYSYDS
jgi:YD repeat-containing protein